MNIRTLIVKYVIITIGFNKIRQLAHALHIY